MEEILNQEQLPETMNTDEEINIDISDGSGSSDVIAEIPSAMYGAFVKILSFLSSGMGSEDVFFIKEGKLNAKKSAGFLYSDMTALFNENDFEIQDPANAVKLLSLIKGGEKVVFLKDSENQEYIISSIQNDEPQRMISLPIPDIPIEEQAQKPEIGELVKEFEIDVSRIEDLVNASKITESYYFIVNFDENFELISIETSNKKFKDIFNKNEIKHQYKLFDLMLVSKPDTYKLQLYKNNDDYFIKTISDIDLVEIEYIEKIDTLSEFDAFAL